jgi:hypothetical protein
LALGAPSPTRVSNTRTGVLPMNPGALGVTALLAEDASEVPAALVAVAVNVYAVPLVSPVTVAVVGPAVLALAPPGDAVTVYPVTGEPPLLAGAVHDTTAEALPAIAVTAIGDPGTVRGVTATLGDEAGEVPAALVAVAVNVYAVPLVSPVSVAEVAMIVVALAPPGDAVTVYPVTGEPPLLAGAVHDTTAWVFPPVAITAIGDPGTVPGVTATLGDEAGEVPAALVAVTVNVYAVPLVSPVTVAVVAPAVRALAPPGDAVTVYPVTAEPPLLAGAVQLTTAETLPAAADTPVGAPGAVAEDAVVSDVSSMTNEVDNAASSEPVKETVIVLPT